MLVPIDVAAAVALVPFKGVGEHLRGCAETEVERRVGAEDYSAGHFEAVKVAREVHGGGRQLLVLEIVTRGVVYFPSVGDCDVTREVHVLCELVGVAHGLDVYLCRAVLGHCYSVRDGEVPR